MTRKADNKRNIGEEIIEGLTEFRDALRDAAPVQDRFTVRRVELDLRPSEYDGEAVQRLRHELGASQAVFAHILGVSVSTIQSWEQGRRTPGQMASRFLDEINRDVEEWRKRLENATVEEADGLAV